MKQVTDLEAMKGKVIEKAVLVDSAESLVIIFADDTYAHVDVNIYGESHDLDLDNELDMYDKHDAGIITDDEYSDYEDRGRAISAANAEVVERRQLLMLKAKYEP